MCPWCAVIQLCKLFRRNFVDGIPCFLLRSPVELQTLLSDDHRAAGKALFKPLKTLSDTTATRAEPHDQNTIGWGRNHSHWFQQ